MGLSVSALLIILVCGTCIWWCCRTRVDEDDLLTATRARVTKHSGRNAKMSDALNISKCAAAPPTLACYTSDVLGDR